MKRLLIASAAAVILALASTASAQVPQRPTGSPVVQPPAPAPNVEPPASAQQPPPAAPLRRLPGAPTTQLPGSAPTGTRPPAAATTVPSGPAPAPATGTLQPPPGAKQQSAAPADGLPPPPTGWRLPGDTEGLPMSSQVTASAEARRRSGLRPTRPSAGYMPSRLDPGVSGLPMAGSAPRTRPIPGGATRRTAGCHKTAAEVAGELAPKKKPAGEQRNVRQDAATRSRSAAA